MPLRGKDLRPGTFIRARKEDHGDIFLRIPPHRRYGSSSHWVQRDLGRLELNNRPMREKNVFSFSGFDLLCDVFRSCDSFLSFIFIFLLTSRRLRLVDVDHFRSAPSSSPRGQNLVYSRLEKKEERMKIKSDGISFGLARIERGAMGLLSSEEKERRL